MKPAFVVTRSWSTLFAALICAALTFAGGGLAAAPAASALENVTWVSGVGDDVNPCTRTAPCRTFAGAISKTNANGQINALDSGGFSGLTISKSITIDASAVLGGVLVSGTDGIVINAAAADRVILRGLTINGGYANGSPCAPNALSGVRVNNAGYVRIEHTTISNTSVAGVRVSPLATSPRVVIDHTAIRNSCQYGVQVVPTAGNTANVLVSNSTISNAGTAVMAAEGGAARVTDSAIFANNAATATSANGTVATDASDQIVGNTATGTPSQTSPAAGGATRTWVSGVGDDANPCSRTAPCKTLQGAFSKTATGGMINAIDSGSFGPLSITRAMTVDLSNVQGGVVSSGIGVTVAVGPAEDVVLRGLNITGTTVVDTCRYQMTAGVRVVSGRSVHIEDSRISNFSVVGVSLEPTATTKLLVEGTDIRNGCGYGLMLAPGLAGRAEALLHNSSVNNASIQGVRVLSRGHLWLAGSTISNNETGLATIGSGQISVFDQSNVFGGNFTDGVPTEVVNAPAPVPTPTVTVTSEPQIVVQTLEASPPAPAPTVTVTAPGPVVPSSSPSLITQRPLGCTVKWPKKVKKSRTYKLLSGNCYTNAENLLTVTVTGRAKIVRGKAGKRNLRTQPGRGSLTITASAPATATHAAYSLTRDYTY